MSHKTTSNSANHLGEPFPEGQSLQDWNESASSLHSRVGLLSTRYEQKPE